MFPLWRLSNLSESSDGHPLAKTVSDLLPWSGFPYHRLSTSHWIVAWTMRPEVVVGLVLFYWVSKRPLKALVTWIVAYRKDEPLSSSKVFRFAIGLHNFILALYSAVTVMYSWPIVGEHILQYGIFDTYCDPHKTLWHSGFGAWALLFYISKYYEFVDTWILILKVQFHSWMVG